MKPFGLPAAGLFLLLFSSGLLPAVPATAQSRLDSVVVKTLRGANTPFSSLVKKDTIVLLCFWASSTEASINELNAINTKFESWTKLASFKMIAVCVNEGKDIGKVRPMVNAYEWAFDVCIDYNGDLRKALNSIDLPQSIILYKGQVVYQQSGFQPGSEDYLIKRIQTITPRR
jgi:hypothetical protein